jgi:hypothetical protein
MAVRDDTTAQAIQIGAVLFFGIRIISFATYQAFVFPNQNRSIGFSHNQALQGHRQELRNAIVSMSGGGTERAVSVSLGVTYPSHFVALNPGPASGSLRTAGTTDPLVNVSVANATAVGMSEETGDFWNGDGVPDVLHLDANTNELRYLDATTGTVTTVTDDTGSSVTATDTGVS